MQRSIELVMPQRSVPTSKPEASPPTTHQDYQRELFDPIPYDLVEPLKPYVEAAAKERQRTSDGN